MGALREQEGCHEVASLAGSEAPDLHVVGRPFDAVVAAQVVVLAVGVPSPLASLCFSS